MFVVIISFPPIQAGREAEFEEWFASSNSTFSSFPGFMRRRLLRPIEKGNYAAIVEFENRAAFEAMHASPAHDLAGDRVRPLFDGRPVPQFYEVVMG